MRSAIWIVGLAACAFVGGVGCGKKSGDESIGPEGKAQGGLEGPSAAVGDVSGTYTITSATNPGGAGGYKGTVTITKKGGVYTLGWAIPDQPAYSGVAIAQGGTLAVGWGMGSRYGVVVYRVEGGKLTGQWATAGSGPTPGTEVLEGPEGLNGTYKIVSAKSPDGKTYSGTVAITPTGSTYSVKWTLPSESYSGVAIKEGDLLVVGWGEAGKGAGAVSYQVRGNILAGSWASPGGTQLGTETLAKN
jgi:hypothetical protein